MGRNRLIIDWSVVTEMLEKYCSGVDVAQSLGIHPETLYKKCKLEKKMSFDELVQKSRGKTMYNLRAAQIQCALGFSYDNVYGQIVQVLPNVEMLKFLGKQHLNQSEKAESKWSITGYILEDESGKILEDSTTAELDSDNED